MLLTVGRIGRVHGIRGEVTVEVLTDSPDERFYPGAEFATEPARAGGLILSGARWHNSTLLLAFEGITDRNGGELLRGIQLLAEVDLDDVDEGEYHIQQLIGLQVFHISDTAHSNLIGEVSGVITGVAQDLLEIAKPDGGEFLIPFVKALVPEVDITAGRVLIDPPGGLINED
ncbi:MAG: ribosome maturation factor RimM [Actinobacteria bacterium]|nr:ribosome maturation factor RimM [Actinomycetota bacterium]